jgi:hypothetical protein
MGDGRVGEEPVCQTLDGVLLAGWALVEDARVLSGQGPIQGEYGNVPDRRGLHRDDLAHARTLTRVRRPWWPADTMEEGLAKPQGEAARSSSPDFSATSFIPRPMSTNRTPARAARPETPNASTEVNSDAWRNEEFMAV